MAAAYSNAESRIDPRLPLVDTAVSELGSAAEPPEQADRGPGRRRGHLRPRRHQPAERHHRSRHDLVLPGPHRRPDQAGSVKWSLHRRRHHRPAATDDATVGPNPTKNVAVTGSATEPESSVSFKVTGTGGTDATFTAQRRMRTAQELAARLSRPPGRLRHRGGVRRHHRALTFPISTDSDPGAKALPYAFGDLFRTGRAPARHHRRPDTTLSVNVGKVAMAGTLGLLLAPTSDEDAPVSVADRAFLKVSADAPEVSVAGISANGAPSPTEKATGMVGMTKVALAGSGIELQHQHDPRPAGGHQRHRQDRRRRDHRRRDALRRPGATGRTRPASPPRRPRASPPAARSTATADELPAAPTPPTLDLPRRPGRHADGHRERARRSRCPPTTASGHAQAPGRRAPGHRHRHRADTDGHGPHRHGRPTSSAAALGPKLDRRATCSPSASSTCAPAPSAPRSRSVPPP